MTAVPLIRLGRRRRLAALVIILLIAAAFRLVGLNNVTPPGLEHDEIAHWLINRDILAGNHAIYFTEAYGHEALFHYVQTGFGALVGDNPLTLRLTAAYFGIALVAISYALGRRLFGWQVGLVSAAFLAVLFWAVFYSRLSLRAVSLPVLSGLSACLWWQAAGHWAVNARSLAADSSPHTQPSSGLGATALFLISGALAGLSLHTYMAARAVPIFYALFTLYLLLFRRAQLRRYGRGLIAFWLALIVVAAPLIVYLLTNPGVEARLVEVDAPLRALRAGDWRPALENGLRIAGMFGVRGDPLWRQNIAGRPVFDPLLAACFYLSLPLFLWRWRDDRYAFLLLWLATSILPSLVTVDAPSSIRIINLLPVLMLFPIIFIHSAAQLSTVSDKLSTELVSQLITVALLALLLLEALQTAHGLWRVWPQNEEVQFVWQTALTNAAAYLDDSVESGPAAVGGWTPETMDPPTMELTLRRDDLGLRYFDPTQSLILPATAEGETVRLVWPAILPLAPLLGDVVGGLQSLPAGVAPGEQFALFRYEAPFEVRPSTPVGVDFGGELRLLGYTADDCAGDACSIVTYWHAIRPATGPRRLFLHLVDPAGAILAQDDRLGAPAEYWQSGDIVVQVLTLPSTAGELRLGVYDPAGGRRLATGDGRDYLPLELP